MQIHRLPMLSDNYAWLLVDPDSGDCAVVDPAEAGPVLERIGREGWHLRWILATHHHWDHTGGNAELCAAVDGLEVLCSRHDLDARQVPGAARALDDGAQITIAGDRADVYAVPGHTLGAIAYHFAGAGALFTGDTLFLAGCGRLFEGTPEMMHGSLSRLAELADETQVYCGHEYTEKNLSFAASLMDDAGVSERLAEVRAAKGPTVPAALGLEKKTNPFLRTAEPALQDALGIADPVALFTEIRARRNGF